MTQIRQVTVDIHGFHLVKDLDENERICTTCKGLGLVISDYPYGIHGERRTDGKLFPYNKPYVGQCPSCYVGVQTLCEHCGKPFPKLGVRQCHCDRAKAERAAFEAAADRKRFEEAEKLTVQEALAAGIEYAYVDGLDKYFPVDELEDLDDDERENAGAIWACTSQQIGFDAGDIIDNACEDLHEDARDRIGNAAQVDLQALLDGWVEKHGAGTTTYYPSAKRAIIPPWAQTDLAPVPEGSVETNG